MSGRWPSPPKGHVWVRDATKELGVGHSTLYDWASKGLIKFVDVDGRVCVADSDFQYLARIRSEYVISVRQVAVRLGFSESTIIRAAENDAVNSVLLGRVRRFREQDIVMLEQKLHVYDINGTQALKRLDIAWATLRSWTERGALSSYWFGATRYYSSIEVDKLAQELGSLNGSQVAKIFRRHRNTVTRMGDRGELRYSVTPAGQRRYHTADVRLATKPPGRQKGV